MIDVLLGPSLTENDETSRQAPLYRTCGSTLKRRPPWFGMTRVQ